MSDSDNNNDARYAAPRADVAAIEAPIDANAPLASRGRRLATFALDFVFFHALAALLGFVLALVGAGDWIEGMTGIEERLFGIAVFLTYYLLTEALTGRSLAKRFTGTRVVTASGTRPTSGQLIKRSFARLVPFEFLSIFRTSMLMWHDDWSATRTVYIAKS